MGTRLIYAGIDEAGYGPLLGPLCVGMSVLEVRGWDGGGGAGRPDVWGLLSPAVVREVREAGASGVVVNDSKRVKVSGSAKRHPLEFLERGILSVASCMGRVCASDADVYGVLGVSRGGAGASWYGGDRVPVPLASTAEQIGLAGARLRGACERGGVSFEALRCCVCDEGRFNDEVRKGALKSEISFARVAALMREVWDRFGDDAGLDSHGPRMVVDRQGGRIGYARPLARVFGGAEITALMEHPEASVYDIREGSRRMRVTFSVGADGDHFPVALASMCAKFVRELAMMRFNRYWCGRITELKPTAGYGSDAKRWLSDVSGVISEEERAALRRLA